MENPLFSSIQNLYNYLFNNFWTGTSIEGPDPGLNFQLRFFRFVKSYLPQLNYANYYYFLQAQGYWIKINWDLFDITGNPKYKKVAIACSKNVLNCQKTDGSWQYPLAAWKKYVSTVEGTWASLGLLETFKHTKESTYFDGALKWYNFLINKTGFQSYKDSLVINYFDTPKHRVPNNTTLVLWFFAELYALTNNHDFLRFNDKMIKFLELCQNDDGELRYSVKNQHYLCYHYNAFELLDLYNFYNLTGNKRIELILIKLGKFVAKGVTEIGSVKYDCLQTFPEVTFYSGVVGAALTSMLSLGFTEYEMHVKYLYDYLLRNQMNDGSFTHSKFSMPYIKKPYSYGFCTDKNRYVRPLVYLLQHLIIKARTEIL